MAESTADLLREVVATQPLQGVGGLESFVYDVRCLNGLEDEGLSIQYYEDLFMGLYRYKYDDDSWRENVAAVLGRGRELQNTPKGARVGKPLSIIGGLVSPADKPKTLRWWDHVRAKLPGDLTELVRHPDRFPLYLGSKVTSTDLIHAALLSIKNERLP